MAPYHNSATDLLKKAIGVVEQQMHFPFRSRTSAYLIASRSRANSWCHIAFQSEQRLTSLRSRCLSNKAGILLTSLWNYCPPKVLTELYWRGEGKKLIRETANADARSVPQRGKHSRGRVRYRRGFTQEIRQERRWNCWVCRQGYTYVNGYEAKRSFVSDSIEEHSHCGYLRRINVSQSSSIPLRKGSLTNCRGLSQDFLSSKALPKRKSPANHSQPIISSQPFVQMWFSMKTDTYKSKQGVSTLAVRRCSRNDSECIKDLIDQNE